MKNQVEVRMMNRHSSRFDFSNGLLTLLVLCAIPLVGACYGPSRNGDEKASDADVSEAGGAGEEQQEAEEQREAEEQQEAPTKDTKTIPEGPPIEGFEQLMARGGIPALFDPKFVAAGEAHIPDAAWVMGFERDGQAYAYDLNTLNHHEIVNHHIGDLPVAAVW